MDSQYKVCNTSGNSYVPQKRPNLKKLLFRYFGQFIICLLGFGLYFCYDNPGTLQDRFEKELNMSSSKFSVLYSIYSWPNVILCFFGGFLLDSVFGIRWGTILYVSIAFGGQLLFAVGAYINVFWLMVLGRFFFGIGAESLYIAQNNYTVLWFRGKQLNAIFALQWSFGQLGSIANSRTMVGVYNFVSENANCSGSECIGIVLLIDSTVCAISMFCAIVLGFMHKHTGKVLKEIENEQTAPFRFADIRSFNLTFWLINLLSTAYTVATYPFISFAQKYFMELHGLSEDEANTMSSMLYTISAVASPFFGIIIDRIQRNIIWVIVGIVGSLVSHLVLAFTHCDPYTCMIFLGLFSSLFGTSVFPMIAHVMPENQLGTAYGMNQAISNFSVAVVSLLCGSMIDAYGYFALDIFFTIWLIVALVPSIIIFVSNPNPTAETTRTEVKPKPDSCELFKESLLQPSVNNANEKLANNEHELTQTDCLNR